MKKNLYINHNNDRGDKMTFIMYHSTGERENPLINGRKIM